MVVRLLAIAAVVLGIAFALWHPAPRAAVVSVSPSPDASERPRRSRLGRSDARLVVYVAGAVRRPGLYRLRDGDRYDRAVAAAGGFLAEADATGVNLAQRAADGEEVLVPRIGESPLRSRSSRRSSRGHHRRSALAPAEGSVDVNAADALELSRVPGIGRAVAARIVELRDREGAYASLDELLDVAGMTQSRLARARLYLRDP